MNNEKILSFVTETKKEEIMKLSLAKIMQMQKELGMSGRKPRNKSEAVGDLKSYARAINRGKAFAKL